MRTVGAGTVAVLLAGALLAPVPPAHAAATCLGRRATIHEPNVRWLRGTNGDDVIVGTSANWSIDALRGDDVICQADALQVEEIDAGRGDDRIAGTARFTRFVGGPGDDVISSEKDASLDGGPGDDVLRGGVGHSGGPGDDVMVHLRGQPWDTYFHGGPGNDVVDSTYGVGTAMFGGAPRGVRVRLPQSRARGWGRDTLIHVEDVEGTSHDDVLIGNDEVHRDAGGRQSNRLSGGAGDDRIDGRGGRDWIEAGFGVDVLRGGDGNDYVDSLEAESAVGALGDELSGGAGDDRISGGSGPDVLVGGDGDDDIAGHQGHNSVEGGSGDDHLTFGGHIESLRGGEGVDTVDFTVLGPVHADLRDQTARLGNFSLQMEGIENVWGSFNGDTLIGDDGPNLLYDGGNYNREGQRDVVAGGGGDDVVAIGGDRSEYLEDESFDANGGNGVDTLTFFAAREPSSADLVTGVAAAGNTPGVIAGFEILMGGSEDDVLAGDDGPNALVGLEGDDELYGRGGHDDVAGDDGDDAADGGDGTDRCDAELEVSCEVDPAQRAALSRLVGILERFLVR
jgi:Ca2+-binding RTX toxin-like protein